MNARFILAAVLAVVCVLARAARADVPPLPFDVTCDVERSSAVAGPCQPCEATFFDADACERALGPKGLTRHCRSGGITQWTEVWCGAQAAPAVSASAAPVAPSASTTPADVTRARGTDAGGLDGPRSGCSTSRSSSTWPSLAAPAACFLILFARRLRVRRPVKSECGVEVHPARSPSPRVNVTPDPRSRSLHRNPA
jgi:hypothetical protein